MKIEIKQWALSDAKELTSLCNAVDRRFLSDRLPYPYMEKDAEEWLKMVTDNDTITGIYRAIVYDGKLIGSISVEKKDDDAEIGYMLLNEYTNKGIATEAVKQICSIMNIQTKGLAQKQSDKYVPLHSRSYRLNK